MIRFSFSRFLAITVKEFIQTARDKPTLGMMICIPVMQIILFGYIINTNPKNLDAAVVLEKQTNITRELIQSVNNTKYFNLKFVDNIVTAEKLMQQGDIGFILYIKNNFTQDLLKGLKPEILLIADNTDPVTTGNAIAAINSLSKSFSIQNLFTGNLAYLNNLNNEPFRVVVHPKYNVLHKSQYNIVPGLLGVILTLTLVIVAALALSRERELGTAEFLLSTPSRPIEIMLGKIVPFIIIGLVQIVIVLFAAKILFSIPFKGSILLLILVCIPFMLANLSIGLTFSTIANNQLQAVQFSIFFFMPSLLLSGFMFPFAGMPGWAQQIGNLLPLTHFVRIIRGILLKGQDVTQIIPELTSILIFGVIAIIIGTIRFRQTLD